MEGRLLGGDSAPWPERLEGLRLEGMAQGGEAVGRYLGRVIFVQGGVPGDVVSVRLEQCRTRYARGAIEAVLLPSPERVAPRCARFGQCGGCSWQHIAPQAQLRFKRAIVEDQCRYLGRIADPPVDAVLGMAEPWRYRHTAELHVSRDGVAGFYAGGTRNVVSLSSCPLLVEPLDALLPDLQRVLRGMPSRLCPESLVLRYSRFEKRVLVLAVGGAREAAREIAIHLEQVAEVAWQQGRRVEVLRGRGYLVETLGGVPLRFSPTAFFQVHPPQAERLLEVVAGFLEPKPGDRLLDAYAGVGALSLPLAGPGVQITAIEEHPAAVEDLWENAARLGAHVEVLPGRVERVLPMYDGRFDLAILDPPRRGCLPPALRAVVRVQPRRIAYVSCHPGTLARDLRRLLAAGYRLVRIQPVDLFPQTFHIESVALLARSA
jgi:23S rRNA (uracil1939-C5)-methyltransferase